MPKHTRKKAEHATGSFLATTLHELKQDGTVLVDSLEHPLSRDVSFPTDIYNVGLLECMSALCGVPSSRFAAEVFAAALGDAAEFFHVDVDDMAVSHYAQTYKEIRFHRERLDAIVTNWRSQQVRNRQL